MAASPDEEPVDPAAFLEIEEFVEDLERSSSPEHRAEVERRIRDRRWAAPNVPMVYDEKRNLWLDLPTIVESAQRLDASQLTEEKKGKVRALVGRMKKVFTGMGALGLAASIVVGTANTYERGIDEYLARSRDSEAVFSDPQLSLRVRAPFLGAKAYAMDAWRDVVSYQERVKAKEDSVRWIRIPSLEAVAPDHAHVADSASRVTPSLSDRGERVLHRLLDLDVEDAERRP
jgi:hypothetical protein